MFSTKLFLSLLAISASALAAPSLSLKVSGADAAEGVENLKVVTTLTNTGDSTLKLLKDPRTVSFPYFISIEDVLTCLTIGTFQYLDRQLQHLLQDRKKPLVLWYQGQVCSFRDCQKEQ